MILLDANVLIFAFDPVSPFGRWAHDTIAGAVAGDGTPINAVSLAEVCVGDRPTDGRRPDTQLGVEILDVPAAASDVCAAAYLQDRKQRLSRSDLPAPPMPLPDFFIDAHAKIMVGARHRGSGRFQT